jgi:RHS repeat-associated protein
VRAEYVWGSLGPVARIAGGRVQLYVCDALGHVRALIDAETGQITDRYDYDAWGNVVHNGSTRQSFVWNGAYGYEWIPEVSLYHVGARAYDPRTARWLQRDPIDAAMATRTSIGIVGTTLSTIAIPQEQKYRMSFPP